MITFIGIIGLGMLTGRMAYSIYHQGYKDGAKFRKAQKAKK